MSTGSLAGRRPRRTRTEARQEILRAANDTFVEQGYEAASLEEIGHRAGVTRTGVLYHFPSKEALLTSLVEPLFRDLDEVLLDHPFRPHPTVLGRRELMLATLDVLLRHRDVTDLLVGLGSGTTAHSVSGAVRTYVRELSTRLGGDAYRTDESVRLRVTAALGAFRGILARQSGFPLEGAAARAHVVAIAERVLDDK